jgi:hypothetical protein
MDGDVRMSWRSRVLSSAGKVAHAIAAISKLVEK